MDAAQIAAMIADRKAGTPGPWRVKVNSRDDQVTCDLTICGDIFQLADLNGPQYAHQHPNARRIARVPDMEATIIAQASEIDRLRAERDDRDRLESAMREALVSAMDDIPGWYDLATDAHAASLAADARRAKALKGDTP